MEKDKEKLLQVINSQFIKLQKEVLNSAELAVPNEKWEIYRKQVLSYVNDTSRRLQKEIVDNYTIEYSPTTVRQDVVEIIQKDRNGNRKKYNKKI